MTLVEIASGGQVLQTHPIRHDRSREHGAFANPKRLPPKEHRRLTPAQVDHDFRTHPGTRVPDLDIQ